MKIGSRIKLDGKRSQMDPISAIVVFMNSSDSHDINEIQIYPALPPATRPMLIVMSVLSEDDMRIMENPSIDMRRKFL